MDVRSICRSRFLKAAAIALFSLAGLPAGAEILQAPGKVSDGALKARNEAVLTAQTKLGANLIKRLAQNKQGDDNVVVSPASVASIFSFVELGSSDAMRLAIHRMLAFPPATRIRAAKDIGDLRSRVSAAIAASTKDGPTSLANLLVFDPSIKPRQMAILGLSGAGADVLVADLSETETIDRINQWVRQRTHDLIPSILEETPESLGLVAINALYFKDKWKTPFNPAQTRQASFTSKSGKTADVAMMHSPVTKFAFRQNDRFIGAELPYANEDFRLVVVTTKAAPAGTDEFAAVSSWLRGEGFEGKTGEILLPRFAVSMSEEMLAPLDKLGLRKARLTTDSLSGFSSASLFIGRVVQKLELRLDEEGTEGAAATAVIAKRSIALDENLKMVVDKPFIFALRDLKTGFVLFMGYVGSPQKLVAK